MGELYYATKSLLGQLLLYADSGVSDECVRSIAELLIEAGANVNHNFRSKLITPLACCIRERPTLVPFLLEQGALAGEGELFAAIQNHRPSIIELLYEKFQMDLNSTYKLFYRENPITQAAYVSFFRGSDVIKLLLKLGAKVSSTDVQFLATMASKFPRKKKHTEAILLILSQKHSWKSLMYRDTKPFFWPQRRKENEHLLASRLNPC